MRTPASLPHRSPRMLEQNPAMLITFGSMMDFCVKMSPILTCAGSPDCLIRPKPDLSDLSDLYELADECFHVNFTVHTG